MICPAPERKPSWTLATLTRRILTSFKWALVIAGISDFARPAEKLSLTQNGALVATGTIWTRWCFVIRPQNYL
jgi:hypothetical protein